jgi:hypothetical protein
LHRLRQGGSEIIKTGDITTLMRALAKLYRTVYIIVDALDEHRAESRASFVDQLITLPFQSCRLLVTSRLLPGIETIFQEYPRLPIEPKSDDIKTFVRTRIPLLPKLASHVSKRPELEAEIIEGISSKAKGM